MPLEILEIEEMASGDLSLALTESVRWEEFADYAADIANILGAEIEDRADTVVERVWVVSVNGLKYWITFNDFALGISLDSQDARASAAVRRLRERLVRWRDTHTA